MLTGEAVAARAVRHESVEAAMLARATKVVRVALARQRCDGVRFPLGLAVYSLVGVHARRVC